MGIFGKSKAQQVEEATNSFVGLLSQHVATVPPVLASLEQFNLETVTADTRRVLNFIFQACVDGKVDKNLGQVSGTLLGNLFIDMALTDALPMTPEEAASYTLDSARGVRAIQNLATQLSRPDVAESIQRIGSLWCGDWLAKENGKQAIMYLSGADEADVLCLLA